MEHKVIRSFIGVIVILSFVDTSAEECVPHNWSYPWSKVGNTWYTKIKKEAIFDDSVTLCEGVEPGRTGIAGTETKEEQAHVIGQFVAGEKDWWLGGIRIGSNQWYWYGRIGGKGAIRKMTGSYWISGHPTKMKENFYCMQIRSTGWISCNCEDPGNLGGVICELRC